MTAPIQKASSSCNCHKIHKTYTTILLLGYLKFHLGMNILYIHGEGGNTSISPSQGEHHSLFNITLNRYILDSHLKSVIDNTYYSLIVKK